MLLGVIFKQLSHIWTLNETDLKTREQNAERTALKELKEITATILYMWEETCNMDADKLMRQSFKNAVLPFFITKSNKDKMLYVKC